MTDTILIARDAYLAIPAKAAELALNRRDGYTPGYERHLACELASTLDDTEQRNLLQILILEKMRELITVDCLLDDEADDSWQTATKMADLLCHAIIKQGNQEHEALIQLVMSAICDYPTD